MAFRVRSRNVKFLCYAFGSFMFYWIWFKTTKYNEVVEFSIEGADPKKVWEYWADFSNWQKLNPNVLDFEVQHENGNYENWEYSVKYEEGMNVFTSARVQIWAEYKVTPEQRHGHFSQPYRIASRHKTCMLVFCFYTDAEMIFVKSGRSNEKATKVIETVDIECFPIFKSFCKKEFHAQRKEILDNVRKLDVSIFA